MARPPELPSLPWLLPLALLAVAGCPAPSTEASSDAGTGDASETQPATSSETGPDEAGTGDSGTGESGTDTDTDGDPVRPARLAVTADWRAHRLSLLDYAAIRDGATTRDAALWKTIELPDHEPGPLEVELTPDGSRALVAVSPGFFGGAAGSLVGLAPGTLPGGGALLIVDVEAGTILAELATAHTPMGIVVSPDGNTAWTANYGGQAGESGTTVSVIDLTTLAVADEFEVGPGPEQLDLTPDGSLAIVNIASDGTVRLFATADPTASLSAPALTSDDPSWVLFLEDGMDRAVAINSIGPSGYSLLDVGDPTSPVVLDTVQLPLGVAYAGALGRTPNEILVSSYAGDATDLRLYDVDTGTISEELSFPVGAFPLGIVFDPAEELALVPLPGADALGVADFTTGEVRQIPWDAGVGPTYVALE